MGNSSVMINGKEWKEFSDGKQLMEKGYIEHMYWDYNEGGPYVRNTYYFLPKDSVNTAILYLLQFSKERKPFSFLWFLTEVKGKYFSRGLCEEDGSGTNLPQDIIGVLVVDGDHSVVHREHGVKEMLDLLDIFKKYPNTQLWDYSPPTSNDLINIRESPRKNKVIITGANLDKDLTEIVSALVRNNNAIPLKTIPESPYLFQEIIDRDKRVVHNIYLINSASKKTGEKWERFKNDLYLVVPKKVMDLKEKLILDALERVKGGSTILSSVNTEAIEGSD